MSKKYKPLPVYPIIKMKDIPPMSAIIEAGSNPATKWFERYVNKWPYITIFTHAFLHIIRGDCANVGLTTTIDQIQSIVKKSHTYIVFSFTDLSPHQISYGISVAYRKAGAKKRKFKIYDFVGFLSFGLRKLGIKVRGKEKYDFCSDQVVDIFQEMNHEGHKDIDSEKTSPNGYYDIFKDYKNVKIYRIAEGA